MAKDESYFFLNSTERNSETLKLAINDDILKLEVEV